MTFVGDDDNPITVDIVLFFYKIVYIILYGSNRTTSFIIKFRVVFLTITREMGAWENQANIHSNGVQITPSSLPCVTQFFQTTKVYKHVK